MSFSRENSVERFERLGALFESLRQVIAPLSTGSQPV